MATASSNPTVPAGLSNPKSPALNSTAAAAGSPKSRRSSAARGVSVSWTQVVLDGESELVPAAASSGMIPPQCPHSPSMSVSQEQIGNVSGDSSPSKPVSAATGNSSLPTLQDTATEARQESFDNSSNGSNAVKKPAWNKPNGATIEASPVMGAVSWPALSESTKASPKSSYDSLKTPSDGLVSLSQGTATATSSSPKHVHTNNTTSNLTPNHVAARHRCNKRAGGNASNSVSANGTVSQPPILQSLVVEMPPNSSGKSGVDSYSRDNVNRDGGQRGGFGSQSHGGNDHQHLRNSPRKGNSRPRPRGDGSNHHTHGGGRDQERGNQEWNSNRSFGGRDAHLQPLRVPSRPFLRVPPPPSPPFIPPLMPMRPLGSPIVYPEVPPVYYVPAPHPDPLVMPMLASVPPSPPVFYQVLDPLLLSKIVNQIDYYFSNENLIKDMYLRKEMDEQGWVPVKLIASFKKVAELTDNIQFILHAVRTSTVVEVQGEKLRPRNDWRRWVLPPSVQYSLSSPQAVQSSGTDVLGQNLQNVTLNENNVNEIPAGSSRN